jgi:hypothetical protein
MGERRLVVQASDPGKPPHALDAAFHLGPIREPLQTPGEIRCVQEGRVTLETFKMVERMNRDAHGRLLIICRASFAKKRIPRKISKALAQSALSARRSASPLSAAISVNLL